MKGRYTALLFYYKKAGCYNMLTTAEDLLGLSAALAASSNNFVGRFDLDFTRKPPFELKQVIG
jgi:hypothetical protein